MAQLGCLPRPETAYITSSLVGSLIGSTRWSSATGVASCPRGCGFFVIFPTHTTKNDAANDTRRNNYRTRHPGKNTRDQGPTDQGIHCHALTRDFSILTHMKCHGSSRPDPHETRISRVTRVVAGRIGLGQEDLKISRVGSGRVRRFSKFRGSGRVGSRRVEIIAGRVGPDRDVSKFSRVGSGQLPRPGPTREI